MTTSVVILGGGGLAIEVYEYLLELSSSVVVRGFLDDAGDRAPLGSSLAWLGAVDPGNLLPGDRCVIAMGRGSVRFALHSRFRDHGAAFFSVIHRTAYCAPSSTIGEGTVVAPFAFVGAYAVTGAGTLVNTYGSVGHHATTGVGAAIAPYGALNGHAAIGDGTFVGCHALITPGRRVGNLSTVADGAIVYRDVGDSHVVTGNPGRALPKLDQP